MPTATATTTAAMATVHPQRRGAFAGSCDRPGVDLAEHRRRTHGVAVAQRGVVGVVDVAGVVLALEVGE